VPSTFGLKRAVHLSGGLDSGDEFSLQAPAMVNGTRQLVAIGERRLERHGLVFAAHPGAVGPHAVRVRSPPSWTPSLAGNCHTAIVTKRNDSVHRPGNSL